ncbi:hypothetical protein M8J76_008025 [Diaphorina citri]|nr:hypothetical protein M8J76_008025 [Diaphorina citri]
MSETATSIDPDTKSKSKKTSPSDSQPSRPVSIIIQDDDGSQSESGSRPANNEGSESEFSSRVGDNEGSEISTVPDKYGFLGGQQYKAYPDNKKLSPKVVSQLLKREKKWIAMINAWDEYMGKHYKKVRDRCRKGIPRKMRPKAWFYLCGGHTLKHHHPPEMYHEFLKKEADPKYLADIEKDIDRQFFHEMKVALVNILKAYSIVNPVVGYCQAQAPIAAFLLMHMPEEDAFWCLYSICDKYLKGYYSPGMEMIQLDGDILFSLLKKVFPHIHKHLMKQQLDPIMYMTEWFLCAFVRTLPWETLLRVWDMFLCEGVKVFFKTALVIIRMNLPYKTYPKLKKEFPSMYETLQALRHPVQERLDEETILNLNLTVEDFQYEHQRQTLKRKKKLQLKTTAQAAQKPLDDHEAENSTTAEPPR